MSTPATNRVRQQLPVADHRRVFNHLWRLLEGRRLALTGVLVLFLLEAATAVVIPLVIGRIVDDVVSSGASGTGQDFWWMLAMLVAAALGAGLFTWLGAVGLSRVAETVIATLREEYVDSALNLPRSVVESAGTGDVVTRASDDIAQISGTLPTVLPRIFTSVFTIVLVGATVTSIDWRFLLAFAIIIPLYALTLRWYLRTAPPVYQRQREVESTRGQDILGTLDNLDTVVALGLDERQLDQVNRSSWEKVRWAMRARIVQNRLFGRLNATQAVGLISVLLIGVWLALTGTVTPGMVTAAALLFQRVIGPLQGLVMVMDDLQEALASLSRLIGVVDVESEDSERSGGASNDGSLVQLHDVSFAYPSSNTVLHNITLDFPRGKTVAIVGPSGSGKSTLAALVSGVHSPTSGELIHAAPPEEVVTLTQETHVFMGTVRENLLLAAPHSTDQELMDALQTVGAIELIASFPQGLDTLLGHGGHSLDPAHAQHLALTRVVLRDPSLVILDEATAEADTADAGLIDAAANAVVKERSALVIAHRLSQAAGADHIVVLDQGHIIESGTHEELVSTDGAYARLWQAWSKGREN